MLETLNRWLVHRQARVILLVFVALCYVFAYRTHPLYPGSGAGATSRGWWTWTDQQRYLEEAGAIAHGRLNPTSYHYPIGYPALGSLLVRLSPAHPFFVPDLMLILVFAAIGWQLARRWLAPIEALGATLLFVITHRNLIGLTMVVPWNTILTQTSLIAGVWVVLTKKDALGVLWLSLLAAVTVLARPIDALAFAPMLVFATWRIPAWRRRLVWGLAGASLIAVTVGATIVLNFAIFGHARTPYDEVSLRSIGFFGYPISYKLYWLLVDGRPLFGETEPGLLLRFPWLMLGIPGVLFFIEKERSAGVAVVLAIALNGGLYLNYNDLLPSDIYRFTLIHYLTWFFPLLFWWVIAACRNMMRSSWVQVGFGLAAVSFVVCLGLRMEPQRFERAEGNRPVYKLPSARPLLVRLPGVPMEKVAELRLDGKPLVEYSQYLAPYVPSDLQLLLGRHATGSALEVPGDVPVEVSRFRWHWSLDRARWRELVR